MAFGVKEDSHVFATLCHAKWDTLKHTLDQIMHTSIIDDFFYANNFLETFQVACVIPFPDNKSDHCC